jgi:hypothetical protein
MPLHTTPAVRVHRRPFVTATIATVAFATSGAMAIVTNGESFANIAQPASPRYHDIEANKARSMATLGLHLAEQPASRALPYDDLEANKARSQRSR